MENIALGKNLVHSWNCLLQAENSGVRDCFYVKYMY